MDFKISALPLEGSAEICAFKEKQIKQNGYTVKRADTTHHASNVL